jgi:hypothetical protein
MGALNAVNPHMVLPRRWTVIVPVMEAQTTLARFRCFCQSATTRAVIQKNLGCMFVKYSGCGSFNEGFQTISRQ